MSVFRALSELSVELGECEDLELRVSPKALRKLSWEYGNILDSARPLTFYGPLGGVIRITQLPKCFLKGENSRFNDSGHLDRESPGQYPSDAK